MPQNKLTGSTLTRGQVVINLTVAGWSPARIAESMEISEDELKRDYHKQLVRAKAEFDAMAVEKLRESISAKTAQTLIFYLKTRGGFHEDDKSGVDSEAGSVLSINIEGGEKDPEPMEGVDLAAYPDAMEAFGEDQ